MLKYYFGNVGLNTLLKLFCPCLFTFNAAIRKFNMLGAIAHVFNPTTWEAEAVVALWVRGQTGLYSEFQDSQSYIEIPPQKQKTIKKNKKKTKEKKM